MVEGGEERGQEQPVACNLQARLRRAAARYIGTLNEALEAVGGLMLFTPRLSEKDCVAVVCKASTSGAMPRACQCI